MTARDTTEVIATLLAAAGLPATDREIAQMVPRYLFDRPRIDALYEVPEAQYADTPAIFTAVVNEFPWDRD